jgi:hypothetical protein
MTVRQLLSNLDSRELTEWMAYDLIEPFGPWREDLRAGIISSTIANALRSKGGRTYQPADFLPQFGEQQQERMTPEQTIAAFAAAFRASPPQPSRTPAPELRRQHARLSETHP